MSGVGGQQVDVVRLDVDSSVSIESAEPGQTLEMLQRAVGGWVDVVRLGAGIDMWVNDEGLWVLDPNPVASAVLAHLGGQQVIAGPVVFAASTEAGETVSLSADQVETLCEWLPSSVARHVADPGQLVAERH